MKKLFFIIIIATAGSWFFLRGKTHSRREWQQVANGVEWRKMAIEDAGFLHSDIEISVLRVQPSLLHVEVGTKKTARQWRESTHSVAAVNGGFFDEKDRSLGLRQNKGKEITMLRHANWGVFFIKNGRAQILHTKDFQNIDKSDITEAIQSGPRLVVNGATTDVKDQWARRTGIGIDAQGHVLIAACDSDLSLREWAKFWAAPNGLHCQQALNLDGGGSTQLSLDSKNVTDQIDGAWAVPDALLVR